MKTIFIGAIFVFVTGCVVGPSLARQAPSSDPCRNARSNADERDCYTKAQLRTNEEVDALTKKIASTLREDAHDPANEAVANGLLSKAADEVLNSQQTWVNYRDQDCKALEDTWTTGSGAGTAYEKCMFDIAQSRLKELHRDFGISVRAGSKKD